MTIAGIFILSKIYIYFFINLLKKQQLFFYKVIVECSALLYMKYARYTSHEKTLFPLQLTIIKVSSPMKSKPLSRPPAICGSERLRRFPFSPSGRERGPNKWRLHRESEYHGQPAFHSRVMEVEWTVCDRKQTGSWESERARGRETCALQSLPVKTLLTRSDSWQLFGNWGQL